MQNDEKIFYTDYKDFFALFEFFLEKYMQLFTEFANSVEFSPFLRVQ